jgi:hypothetical protein
MVMFIGMAGQSPKIANDGEYLVLITGENIQKLTTVHLTTAQL